jgi:hypothetical protein
MKFNLLILIVLLVVTGCAGKTKKSSLVFENRIPFHNIPIFHTEIVVGDAEFNIAQQPKGNYERK